MKKDTNAPLKLESLSEAHAALGLPKPLHPLISLIDNTTPQVQGSCLPQTHVLNFYKISYRPKLSSRLKYGQGYYDFDEGGLLFAAPNQIIGPNDQDSSGTDVCSQFALLI